MYVWAASCLGSDTNSQALTDILLGLLPRYRL